MTLLVLAAAAALAAPAAPVRTPSASDLRAPPSPCGEDLDRRMVVYVPGAAARGRDPLFRLVGGAWGRAPVVRRSPSCETPARAR